MLRSIISVLFLFILSSCASTNNVSSQEQIIPDQKITGKKVEAPIIDDNKFNIAILVPLSKQKEQTGHLVKSAQLAMMNARNPNLNLIPLDSGMITSDPHSLLTTLSENNVKAILGPVYASETEKLSSLLDDKNITILSMSNDSSMKNHNVLTLGVSPDNQADTLIKYAVSQGIKHFYALLPSNKYGKLIDNAVAEIVSTKNEATHSVSWYNEDNVDQVMEDFISSIRNDDHQKKAIFMPQGGSNLAKLNDKLQKHDLSILLIGSQAWDHANILNFPSFNGAMLLKQQIRNGKFYQDFNRFYHAKPTNLDLIAYNAISMLANMDKDNININKQSIIDNNQDFGKYSDVRFTDKGVSLYKMSVVEIHEGHFKNMDNPE